MNLKYTDKQLLENKILESRSYRELLTKLGENFNDRKKYFTLLRKVKQSIKYFNLDVKHFLGKGWSKGLKISESRRPMEDYFNGKVKIGSSQLKERLLKFGYKEHRCEICNNTKWNNLLIPIQLHHKDGNSQNNRLENLQILCPNCHAQTETFCKSKNKSTTNRVSDEIIILNVPLSYSINEVAKKSGLSKAYPNYLRIKKLINNLNLKLKEKPLKIKKEIDPNWRKKPKFDKRKVVHPSKEELEKLVWEKPTSQIAKDYGLSDKSIEKWCKNLNVSKPPRGYWQKILTRRDEIGDTCDP